MRAFFPVLLLHLCGCVADLDELIPAACANADDTAPLWDDIQTDLDNPAIITATLTPQPTGGCASASCHAPGSAANLILVPNAMGDDFAANYTAFRMHAMQGAMSAVLQKNLQGSAATHAGGKNFDSTTSPFYQRWLAWIEACNPR